MKRIYATLTPSARGKSISIDSLIDQLEELKKNLRSKTELFLDRLLDEGIRVAASNTGGFGSYIVFEKQITESESEFYGVLIGQDREKIFTTWDTKGGQSGYEISPILLAEFGSGWYSEVLFDVQGVGQGTMPNAKGHAFDKNGWSWSENGVWHHSRGTRPTHPMHEADIQMLANIDRIAKEVFNG